MALTPLLAAVRLPHIAMEIVIRIPDHVPVARQEAALVPTHNRSAMEIAQVETSTEIAVRARVVPKKAALVPMDRLLLASVLTRRPLMHRLAECSAFGAFYTPTFQTPSRSPLSP